MMSSATIRRKAQTKAAELGCHIDRERTDAGPHYYVTGPDHLYGDEVGQRDDPLEGNHICTSWEEVTDALEVYETDLLARAVGMEYPDRFESDSDTVRARFEDRVSRMQEATARSADAQQMWANHVRGDALAPLQLLDWFIDQGHDDLAAIIREAITPWVEAGSEE